MSACATDRAERIGAAAARAQAEAAIAEAAATGEVRPPLPALPADCRRTERAGVSDADKIDAALAKYDAALGRQNDRGRRCAAWWDDTLKTHGESR